jgi:hypothetical protein
VRPRYSFSLRTLVTVQIECIPKREGTGRVNRRVETIRIAIGKLAEGGFEV